MVKILGRRTRNLSYLPWCMYVILLCSCKYYLKCVSRFLWLELRTGPTPWIPHWGELVGLTERSEWVFLMNKQEKSKLEHVFTLKCKIIIAHVKCTNLKTIKGEPSTKSNNQKRLFELLRKWLRLYRIKADFYLVIYLVCIVIKFSFRTECDLMQ